MHEKSVFTRNPVTLEALLKRGLELHAWMCPTSASLHAEEVGVCIHDPNDFSYEEIEVKDSSYGETFTEALHKAMGRWT
jgi:hypothetical protein